MKLSPIAAVFLAIFPAAANAHGVWLAPRHGEMAVVYGAGPMDDGYSPDKLRDLKAHAVDGTPLVATLNRQKNFATINAPKDAAFISLQLDNGVWTKGPDGKNRNVARASVPGAQSSLHSYKYNTHVVLPEAQAGKPVGHKLEIVPLANPVKLKVGDMLPMQVLFEGKPLAGAILKADYVNDANMKSGKTDAEGKVTLPVRNDGLNVIGVSYSNPVANSAEIDRESLFATLSFVITFVED
jgi:nickel transport protein